jgi:hypothetical protein
VHAGYFCHHEAQQKKTPQLASIFAIVVEVLHNRKPTPLQMVSNPQRAGYW